MHRLKLVSLCASALLLAAPAFAGQISGDYVETRNADVYTGHCFANAEVGLTGTPGNPWRGGFALETGRECHWMAWPLLPWRKPPRRWAILSTIRILRNRFSSSIEKATEDQKCALVEFAKAMGGRLLENVVLVQSAPISLEVGEASKHGSVVLQAGNLARIQTRALGDKDHLCGNETTYYPPLTELSHAMPAYTLSEEYRGSGLEVEWRINDKRSAFVGTFSR